MTNDPGNDAEERRLAEIADYAILDSPAEANFDRVAGIVAAVFNVEFAMITLVDRDRCWYKAQVGLGYTEMPRAHNMCDTVIQHDDVYVVEDANSAAEELVHPLLRLGMRFYAGAPIRSGGGTTIGTICAVGSHPRTVTERERGILESLAEVVRDELELRRASQRIAESDEALRLLNHQLEAASRNKSEFLSSMAHELRAPLNGILGASENLLQGLFGTMNDRQQEYVQGIHASGRHLLSLINDVLDLSRIEAGQVELHREVLDVARFMEDCASMVRGIAAARPVQLTVNLPSDAIAIEADERRLKQVGCNLLSNAVKFSPMNGEVRFSGWTAAGETVFVVEDEGPGIASDDQERIFDQFFRLPGDHEGSGLGLAVARQLVELHGGRIWLESAAGSGSRFFFAVPASAFSYDPVSPDRTKR